ncbi:protein HGH1 homolog [Galleria mellonella]|uniref:Protein HGH1 homolog n=1 Tax=Galleria mellonella TaxID=7137 RepID=A0A6J1WV77_GALME|nr:protein HGH1 homolog [Galleria mellonella]
MSNDPLNEILEFLKPEARIDLKHISLDHLVGLSGTEEGICTLLQNEQIIRNVIELSDDKVEEIAKNALLLLVNITATAKGAAELLKYKPNTHKNILELLIGYVLNPQKRNADAACMILSNVTRLENQLEICIDTFLPHLNDILNAFVNIEFNKKGSNLNYLAPMFSNLSCSSRIRKWLTEESPHVPLIKLLPFCNFDQSVIRRGGALSTIRNLSLDTEYHTFLLSTELDLLTYLLSPLMGNEDYPDEEMDMLPIALQYLPKEKKRETDVDIRKIVLETLNKLCSKRHGREILRENGVYYVLREYHKWEKDPKVLLTCENVVDILIQKEEEVGAEDLSTVNVPDDMVEKFQKMDEDYLKNVE